MTTQWQDKHENFFFVVDLHAITVPQDPKQLKTGVINAVAAYLAAGIDPEKSKVFVQVWFVSSCVRPAARSHLGRSMIPVFLSVCRTPA